MKKLPVFIDSSYWIAFLDAKEERNPIACRQFQALKEHVSFTSNFIIFETLTYLNCTARRHDLAIKFHDAANSMCTVIHAVEMDIDESLQLFFTYNDTPLSIVDCISFSIMRRIGIPYYAGFDSHFSMLGFSAIL